MSELPEPLQPCNPIHDPVHGRIWLTRLELELVNTPEFQRLRRISQLCPADFVFPGSTHSRFAHSLGAAHVMGLILRQPALQKHFEDREELIQILRLAALLHDIGHLPFSHVGEFAWSVTADLNWTSYMADDHITALDVVAAGGGGPCHEDLSAAVVRSEPIAAIIDAGIRISGDHGGSITPSELVARIILSVPTEVDKGDAVIRNLLSSELDCDRLDYLLRDSHAAGLTYGQADLWYLIENMTVLEDERIGTVLAVEKHGKTTCEHYLLARYYHYAQLVGHKTVGAAELALGAGILELIRLEQLPDLEAVKASIENPGEATTGFLELTDDAVLSLLASAPKRFAGESSLVDYSRRIIERKLPKVAADDSGLREIQSPTDPNVHPWDAKLPKGHFESKATVANECDIDPNYFTYNRSHRTLSGINPSISQMDIHREGADALNARMTKAAKVAGADRVPVLLLDDSPLIKTIASRRWATRRVVALEPLDSYAGSGKKRTPEFERLKDYFEQLLPIG